MSDIMVKNNQYENYWYQRKHQGYRFRYGIFLKWVKPNSRVIDIGSGDGALAKLLNIQNKCKVICVDASETAIQRAKFEGLDARVVDITQPLPFSDGSFDCVIASEVIEHIVRSEDLLKEMARIASQDIIISIPNSAFWKYRLQLLFGHFPKQWVLFPYEHVRFWSISDFKTTVKRLGFKLEDVKAGSGRRYLRDFWPSMFAQQVCYKISKK